MKSLTTIVVVAALTLSGVSSLTAQTKAQIDYDTFCKLPDVTAKQSAFRAATAENRAVLVRTQIERWRDANAARLSPAQATFLGDLLALVTAENYADGPRSEEAMKKMRDLEARAGELLSPEARQAIGPNGPCIPKVK